VKKLPYGTIIAGELHVKVEGGRCRVGDLSALIGEGAKADLSKLCFGAFDLVKSLDVDIQDVYTERLAELKKLLTFNDNLFVIDSQELDRKQLSEKFESEVVTGKSEGLIARLTTGLIYKLKPAITIDAVVIAYPSLHADYISMVLPYRESGWHYCSS
jgi:ATP-dependent DNA ligase